ncbi:MAG: PmoA family protein [Acidobacteria bacterium]|nr:PmoA family protein [Acidobacteriota bacterium]
MKRYFYLCLFLCLVLAALPAWGQVKVTQRTDRILIDIDGKPFSEFFIGAGVMKPYLHPLRSASGKIVTRRYPMEAVEGESKDHPHHRGLWFTHGDVNGYDFWGNEPSQKGATKNGKGKVVTKRILDVKSGKKSGSVKALFEWQTMDGKPLLTETRGMIFYSDPKLRTMDFDILLTAVEKVKFGDTKEGVFAIRLATPLEEQKKMGGTGKMVNAEGKEGEKQVWGKASPWVDYYGTLEGETLGIAILDHPTSPRHPTYWHSRAYGLFASNIWGLHDFVDKTKDGSQTLEAGQSLRFRIRVVIHPGDTAAAGIAGLYKKFATMK